MTRTRYPRTVAFAGLTAVALAGGMLTGCASSPAADQADKLINTINDASASSGLSSLDVIRNIRGVGAPDKAGLYDNLTIGTLTVPRKGMVAAVAVGSFGVHVGGECYLVTGFAARAATSVSLPCGDSRLRQ